MSGDEILFLMVHGLLALLFGASWFFKAPELKHFGRPIPGLRWYYLTLLFCFAIVVVGLQFFAASDVRSTFYVVWYTIMWVAWVGCTDILLLPRFGIRFYDDVLERRNPAMMVVEVGVLLGLTLAFLGGNFGEGPSWAVVALCTVISFGGFIGLWVLMAVLSPLLQRLTIERDLATAIRIAGLFVCFGMVLGRAVAGDWESVQGTFVDFFKIAWVLLLPAVLEVLLTRLTAISRKLDSNAMIAGVIPAVIYVALGAGYVIEVGWW